VGVVDVIAHEGLTRYPQSKCCQKTAVSSLNKSLDEEARVFRFPPFVIEAR
jgi:hypothetical protein